MSVTVHLGHSSPSVITRTASPPNPRSPNCAGSRPSKHQGKTVRHRLNRGGNRDANRALHVICAVRLRRHQPTRDYLARRTAEGKTKAEIMRCLKRYIAREVYRAVQESLPETIAH